MTTINPVDTIINGPRDDTFKNLIVSLLRRGKMATKYIDQILDEDGMDLYSKAFTHPTADESNNYEFYEMMGDASVNCAIVWYLNRKFPHLHCPGGVKIIARLKIILVSKRTFGPLAEKLGLWPFVTASKETKGTQMKQTLEDVFEAFFGVTQTLIDNNIKMGRGSAIIYNMIESIYDEHIPISLKYEDLFDAKTRLKETFDFPEFKDNLTELTYHREKNMEEKMNTVTITARIRGHFQQIGIGKGTLKPTAEQNAARNAIYNLQKKGYTRPIPERFREFCT